mmetsp:Transcript_460/g.943  ORF Transcript_460/g.943 Transcript_460/m.943 type:complete len:244 (+) Transcript_460:863-1594(+)
MLPCGVVVGLPEEAGPVGAVHHEEVEEGAVAVPHHGGHGEHEPGTQPLGEAHEHLRVLEQSEDHRHPEGELPSDGVHVRVLRVQHPAQVAHVQNRHQVHGAVDEHRLAPSQLLARLGAAVGTALRLGTQVRHVLLQDGVLHQHRFLGDGGGLVVVEGGALHGVGGLGQGRAEVLDALLLQRLHRLAVRAVVEAGRAGGDGGGQAAHLPLLVHGGRVHQRAQAGGRTCVGNAAHPRVLSSVDAA